MLLDVGQKLSPRESSDFSSSGSSQINIKSKRKHLNQRFESIHNGMLSFGIQAIPKFSTSKRK